MKTTVVAPAGSASAKLSAEVLVESAGPADRRFFGEGRLVNSHGSAIGQDTVIVRKATGRRP
ncbi:hypothetical protein [Streptomyces sp. NPDC014676]|uniref:hypothetical protein n=1 Tax=Streptomyces sp. NPDC014676 TaxID=3364879 RepID=UPI0037024DAF